MSAPVTAPTSTVSATMLALRDTWRERPNLYGIQISTAPLGADTDAESIQLVDVNITHRDAAIGRGRRKENYTVSGGVWVVAYGASDDDALAARDRAFELLAEIEQHTSDNPRLDNTVFRHYLDTFHVRQGVNDDGRWCQINFGLKVEAYLS